ncbi:MAG: branched-chain amino acid transport system permease protein [Candidatus Atribacteria bacterium]|nr:branched-chain amino acid transport system permease protein [Candidatus Atribacteria bacterium]
MKLSKSMFFDRRYIIVVVFVVLYLLRYVLPEAFVLEVVIQSIYVMGCSFLIGRLGLVSFGQPVYLAAGAYGTAFYLYYVGTNPYIGILVGVLMGLMVSIVAGVFLVRLSSSYFTLSNLAFCAIGFFLLQKVLVKYTHGDNGLWFLSKIDSTVIIDLSTTKGIVYFSFLIAIGVWFLYDYLMDRSVFGAACLAVKINEEKLRFLGYNAFNVKWLAFVIANTTAALAGSLNAIYLGFVSPSIADVSKAVEAVAISMLGGAGTLFGPVAGVLIFIGLKDIISQIVSHWELVVGIMLVAIMIRGEKGIVGSLEGIVHKSITKNNNKPVSW